MELVGCLPLFLSIYLFIPQHISFTRSLLLLTFPRRYTTATHAISKTDHFRTFSGPQGRFGDDVICPVILGFVAAVEV